MKTKNLNMSDVSNSFTKKDLFEAFSHYAFTSISNQPYNEKELLDEFEKWFKRKYEHQESLNISDVSKSKSKSYLNEVKKQNILDDLKRIENYVSILHNMIDKSQYFLDDETKQNILELKETSHQIYNQEMDKELKRQKKDGKEFLSDSDVDDLIDKIKREEGF